MTKKKKPTESVSAAAARAMKAAAEIKAARQKAIGDNLQKITAPIPIDWGSALKDVSAQAGFASVAISKMQLNTAEVMEAYKTLLMRSEPAREPVRPYIYEYTDMTLLTSESPSMNQIDFDVPTGSSKLDGFLRDEFFYHVQMRDGLKSGQSYYDPLATDQQSSITYNGIGGLDPTRIKALFIEKVLDGYERATRTTLPQYGGENSLMNDVAAACRRLYLILGKKMPRFALYGSPFEVARAERLMTGMPLHMFFNVVMGHDRTRLYPDAARKEFDAMFSRIGSRSERVVNSERALILRRIERQHYNDMKTLPMSPPHGIKVTPGIMFGYYDAFLLAPHELEHAFSDPQRDDSATWMLFKLARFIAQRVSAISFGNESIAVALPPSVRVTLRDDKQAAEVIKRSRGDMRSLDRLHNAKGAALAWRSERRDSDYALYFYNGVEVSEDIILHPEHITTSSAMAEQNAEIRRIMIEIMGVERFVEGGQAKVISADKFGELLEITIGDPGDRWNRVVRRVVKVKNATPNPDGTYKDYYLFVPPSVQTAQEAVAWTFYLTPAQYNPHKEA